MLKKILLTVTLFSSLGVFAEQPKKMSPPPTYLPARTTNTVIAPTTTFPVYSGVTHQEISGQLGLLAGAVNLGISYNRPQSDSYGWGGYFFMQTAKDKNGTSLVEGVTAFGAMIKINVINNASVTGYMAPGFGIAMIKNSARDTNETVFGPSFKIGAAYKINPDFSLGVERFQAANWLNDKVQGTTSEFYSFVGQYQF